MQTSRWPISKLPIAHLEPFPYHKGELYVELLDRLAKYVTNQLHPNLRETVEEMVEELEQILALQHGKYVEGIQDFQRIHDAFMTDVNSALMALNDNAVSDLVEDPGSRLGQTIRSVMTGFDSYRNHYTHEYFGITTANANQRLPEALDTIPAHSILTLPADLVFEPEESYRITKPVTIRGGTYQLDQSSAFRVESSDVTLESMIIEGPGLADGNRSGYYAIDIAGTLSNRRHNITLRGLQISQIPGTCIGVRYADGFTVEDCHIHDYTYCGITVHTGSNGVITRNTVERGNINGELNENAYGIAVTDILNTNEARSRDIEVSHNIVRDIPTWEGLDTHGGINISFLNNIVTGCRNGIVLTQGAITRAYPPEGCIVMGNTIDGQGVSSTNGIMIGGWRDGMESPVRQADAVITNNITRNVSRPINYYPFVENPSQGVSRSKTLAYANVDSRHGIYSSLMDTGWVAATTLGVAFDDWDVSNLLARIVQELNGHTVMLSGTVTPTVSSPDQRILHLDGNHTSPGLALRMPPSTDATGHAYAMDVTSSGIYRKSDSGTLEKTLRVSAQWHVGQ